MATGDESYTAEIQRAEERLLRFLRTFETVQEELHIHRLAEAQAQLRQGAGNLFTVLPATLSALAPPSNLTGFHTRLSEAVTHLADAYALFLSERKGPQFGQGFLNSRQALCRGLYILYDLRAHLPTLRQYWLLPDSLPVPEDRDVQPAEGGIPTGFIHKPRTNTHAEYSLYVPEYYVAEQSWPLIVCLHGGYGRGDDYIWTWLRPAKSKGYLLLSPKSVGPTWSALNPPLDNRSITAMLDEVLATYTVDRKRIYLTGLSDGGIFTYIFGLAQAELFAKIAPVAGELHPMADPLLRQGKGKGMPILVVHGVHDFIFPVESVRQTNELLQKLGYNLTYKELPDWGHAYCSTINEQIVLPWFEQ